MVDREYSSVVDQLLSLCKALALIPCIVEKKNERKKGKEGGRKEGRKEGKKAQNSGSPHIMKFEIAVMYIMKRNLYMFVTVELLYGTQEKREGKRE
jgi:predicted transposase YdaD